MLFTVQCCLVLIEYLNKCFLIHECSVPAIGGGNLAIEDCVLLWFGVYFNDKITKGMCLAMFTHI